MARKNILLRGDLKVKLFLVGYKNIGESVIIFIFDNENIIYSGVIDSYEDDINKTISVLEKYNVKYLNFICWTHPDEDHSIGIDILLDKYATKNTQVIIPENITGKECEYNERVKNTFLRIDNILKSRKSNVFSVKSASDTKTFELFDFDRGALGKEEFKIYSIAPNSTIVRKNEFNETLKKNDYSIGLIITIGYFTILLGGDMENKTIRRIDQFAIPEIIDLIKIPHHTSDSSDELLNYLDDNSCEIACTTTYKNGRTNLPDGQVIKLYKNKAKSMYCAGHKKCKDDDNYGVIEILCDVFKRELTVELEGNAYKIYENEYTVGDCML